MRNDLRNIGLRSCMNVTSAPFYSESASVRHGLMQDLLDILKFLVDASLIYVHFGEHLEGLLRNK